MTIPQLRELAAWHDDQASACESFAHGHDRAGNQASAVRRRELAQFHASTAVHLRELADAFSQVFTAIQP